MVATVIKAAPQGLKATAKLTTLRMTESKKPKRWRSTPTRYTRVAFDFVPRCADFCRPRTIGLRPSPVRAAPTRRAE